ncbi:Protein of unknown function DUF1764, eukaryotic [Nannochloropsis gaditana]|uniref:Uncharacterized protein n=1 Tax=Nannochloropsis gaditana TaxID=72520 RepID=W7TIC0_9STRA|nr:Protein of unknown function DUF1764, eukaryotic [Nannochloropsis gaditana]
MNLGTGGEADMGRARTNTAFRPPRPQSKIKKDSRTCNERSHTNRETADVEDKFAGKEEKNLLTDAVRQAGKEIDGLFNDLTQRKRVAAASATTKKAVVKIKKADSRPPSHTVGKNEGRRYDPQRDDPDVRPWKRDATGMPIYDPESMRVGKGGGTALCPFDCNCCFG